MVKAEVQVGVLSEVGLHRYGRVIAIDHFQLDDLGQRLLHYEARSKIVGVEGKVNQWLAGRSLHLEGVRRPRSDLQLELRVLR